MYVISDFTTESFFIFQKLLCGLYIQGVVKVEEILQANTRSVSSHVTWSRLGTHSKQGVEAPHHVLELASRCPAEAVDGALPQQAEADVALLADVGVPQLGLALHLGRLQQQHALSGGMSLW